MSFGRSSGGYGETTRDIFVPANDCGKIIGRGGSKIRDLQDQSGCRIKVMRDDEGDGTRRVELCGSGSAIEDAETLINQTLESSRDYGYGNQTGYNQQSYGRGASGGGRGGMGDKKDVMKIDSSCVGRIIGKGGSRIRELQDQTGCSIKVSRDGGNYGQTDVELFGSSDAIVLAKHKIEEIASYQQY